MLKKGNFVNFQHGTVNICIQTKRSDVSITDVPNNPNSEARLRHLM